MTTNYSHSFLAVAAVVGIGGAVHARHVTHPVTSANINQQPYAFSVKVTDVDKGQSKQFEIQVLVKSGKMMPGPNAHGQVSIAQAAQDKAPTATVTKSDKGLTFTFRIPREHLKQAYFTFTETPDDPKRPFPSPGDYWVFNLGDFAGVK